MSYVVITQAKIAPDYRETAISALKQFKEIWSTNGAYRVLQGILMTGSNVQCSMAFNYFENMADIESAFEAMREASIVKQTMESGKLEILRRGILKDLFSFGTGGSGEAKFIVVTNGTAETPELTAVEKLTNVLNANGAISGRYGQFVMGDQANGKTYLLGAAYPSLSAIQSAYDAVAEDGAAADIYNSVSVQRRQIVRLIK